MKFLTKLALFVTVALVLNLLLIQATVFIWRALSSKTFAWSDIAGHAERFKSEAARQAERITNVAKAATVEPR